MNPVSILNNQNNTYNKSVTNYQNDSKTGNNQHYK